MYPMNLTHSSLQTWGHCTVLQQYPWLIVSANHGSKWSRAIKYSNWVCQLLLCQPWEQHKILSQFEFATVGNTNMTHSRPKTLHVTQAACAEIIHNHITWSKVNHIPRGQFHWLTLKGVYQRAMPGLVKAESDVIRHSDTRRVKMEVLHREMHFTDPHIQLITDAGILDLACWNEYQLHDTLIPFH